MPNRLECIQSPVDQSADERIAYTLTTTNWVASPTSPTAKAYDTTQNDEDVSTTVFPTNTPTAGAGNVITLSPLRDLTVDHSYRIEVKWEVGSSIYEAYFIVNCVR